MRTNCTFKVGLLLAVLAQFVAAQEVVRHPDAAQPLQQRWAWAVEQSNQARFKKGYWIGYSIECLMGENSTIGSIHIKNGRSFRGAGKSLSELIHGIAMPLELPSRYEEKSERMVMKEVGIFLGFTSGGDELRKIHESTFELSVDFKGLPLLWLGEAEDEQSLALLERLYRRAAASETKKDLISAVGLHGESAPRRTFLAGVLAGNEASEIRKQAAFWLGQVDDPEALRILQQTAKTDRSTEVRKQAVFAMSQMHLPEAEDALFELARAQADREVCKDAIFWLAQKGSERAAAFLKDIIYKGIDNSEIQKHAVFSLTQLPDKQGTVVLLDIAENHRSAAVRKEALFWLGQSKDLRALRILKQTAQTDRSLELRKQAVFALSQMHMPEAEDVLIELAQNQADREICKEALFWLAQTAAERAVPLLKDTIDKDADTAIQKQAVFALTQLSDSQGIPVLIDIAKNHRNPAVRKEAIFWLGQSGDSRATEALLKIVRGQE